MNLERVAVIGTSGAGKSTLAKALASRLSAPYVELDSLFWKPGWTATPSDEFERRVANVVSQDRWVIDGNYNQARKPIWGRATAALWLNYPFSISFRRLLLRTIRRSVSNTECCNGNHESLATALFHRDSVLLWAIKSHPVYKREYRDLIDEYAHVDSLEIRHPRDALAFLAGLDGIGGMGQPNGR